MTPLLRITAFVAVALSSLAAMADTVEDLSKKVADMAFRDRVEQQIEMRYWTATEPWLKSKNATLTAEQLAELREAGKAEVPGAYDYVMPPAYEAVASTMSEAELTEFIDKYTPETKDAFKATPLGQKFGKEVMPAFVAAMNGPVNELLAKRLGNYRMAVYDMAVEKHFITK